MRSTHLAPACPSHLPLALLILHPRTYSPHPTRPPQINTDPYGEGWMVKVKLSNPDEVKELMSAKEYEEFCG